MTQTSKVQFVPEIDGAGPSPVWRADAAGIGQRRWFVVRGDGPFGAEYLESEAGQLLRFASHEAAQARVNALNAG